MGPELTFNAPLLPGAPLQRARVDDGRQRRDDPISLAGRDAVVMGHVRHSGGGESLN